MNRNKGLRRVKVSADDAGVVSHAGVGLQRELAEELGGTIIQPAQQVPGTSFGVFADAQAHKVGVVSNG